MKISAGIGIQEIGKYNLFKTRQFGTGFMVGQRLKGKIIDFMQISDRIYGIRVKGHNQNLFVLNIDAPTEEKENDAKDPFYEEMDRVIDKIPKRDITIIMGDANKEIVRKHNKHGEPNTKNTKQK